MAERGLRTPRLGLPPSHNGNYTFTVQWSTEAGRPIKWLPYLYDSSGELAYDWGGRPTPVQIRAGEANIAVTLPNSIVADIGYIFRVSSGAGITELRETK